MEVVGWSPSEQLQDPDVFQLPPQVEGWTGAEDGGPRCVPANPSTQVPLIHVPLSLPVCTPALRRIHFQGPLLLAQSLLPSTSAVSKIQSTSLVLGTHSSSSAAISPTIISPMVARSVPLTPRRGLCLREPQTRGRARHPTPNGNTRI